MYAVRTEEDYYTLARRVMRAIRLKQSMTFTYRALKKDPDNPKRRISGQYEITVRTIEPYDLVTNREGELYIRSLDRKTQEPRSWRLDRVLTYTPHRDVRVLAHWR